MKKTLKYDVKLKLLILLIFFLSIVSLLFNNCIIVWMLMEIVSFTMVYILIIEKDMNSAIFYFMVSMITSLLLYFSIIMKNILNLEEMDNLHIAVTYFMLYMKMGLYPVNFWFLMSSKYMNWMNLFIFSTILKIQPIYLMHLMLKLDDHMIGFIIFNLLYSSLLVLNTNSLKYIMIYSSLIHTCLLLFLMMMSMKLFIIYMILYTLMTLLLFRLLGMLNIDNKFDVYDLNLSKPLKMLMMFLMIMYSSFPPMLTFLMKWMLLESLIMNHENLMVVLIPMLISSTLMTWTYLNLFLFNHYLNSKIKSYSYKIMINTIIPKWLLLILFMIMFMCMLYLYIEI